MLNGHIVRFLEQSVLRLLVCAWAYYCLCSSEIVHALLPFCLEPFFGCLEHYLRGTNFRRLRPYFRCLFICILPRSRYIEFQTLSEVSFIEIKPWRCEIKPNFLSNIDLDVRCSCLLYPIWLSACWVPETCNIVGSAQVSLVHHNRFMVIRYGHKLLCTSVFRT